MAGGVFIPALFILTAVVTFIRISVGTGFPLDSSVSLNDNEYIYGFAYKAVWNKSTQLLFVTHEGDRVLLECDRLDESMIEQMQNGARIRLYIPKAHLRIPDSATNTGGFDQRQYLAGRGVKYISHANKGSIEVMSEYGYRLFFDIKTKFISFSSHLRNSMHESLCRSLSSESASVAMAILTGTTEGISDDDMETYRNAGIAHIMAVSGMHVGFIQNFTMKAVSRRKLPYTFRHAVCLICLIIFAGVSDFSASVTRALLQNAYFLIGGILKRPSKNSNALMIAAAAQLMMNPYAVYNSGFILSYAAAASIVIIQPAISKRIFFFGKIPDAIAAGLAVNIGMTPILIQYFNSISPIGIVVTVFASKIAYGICMSGFLIWFLSFIPLGYVVCKIPAFFTSAAVFGLNKVSYIGSGIPPPAGAFRLPCMPVYAVVIYYLVIFTLLNKKCNARMKKYPVRTVFTVITLFICTYAGVHIYNDRVRVVFFDVGQGFSALIETGDICGLIDTGDGKTNISTLLFKQGVGTLDFVLLTHGHNDHSGGIYDVMNEHNIKCIILPDNPYDETIQEISMSAREKGIDVMLIRGMEEYRFGDMDVILYANEKYMTSDDSSYINNSSVVMFASSEHGSVLFTGDIEKEAETELTFAGYVSDVDLLAVAHHGSATSSDPKNISIISPEYAIISVGRNNSYGHPSAGALDALGNAGAKLRRTDTCGAVSITMRKGNLYPWQKLQI